jgi:hypothetical protein
MSDARTIIVRPATLHGDKGWEVWEAEGVQPFFPRSAEAVDYAQLRARFGKATIEMRDATGAVRKTIPFDGQDPAQGLGQRGRHTEEPS